MASIKATRRVIDKITANVVDLQRKILECITQSDCGVSTVWVTVRSEYDWNRSNKPHPRLGFYDWPDALELIVDNWRSTSGSGIRILVTDCVIQVRDRTNFDNVGLAVGGVGILWRTMLGSHQVLAHELGHYAGYEGDEWGHVDDPTNIMHRYDTEDTRHPDWQWCQRVLGMAR